MLVSDVLPSNTFPVPSKQSTSFLGIDEPAVVGVSMVEWGIVVSNAISIEPEGMLLA